MKIKLTSLALLLMSFNVTNAHEAAAEHAESSTSTTSASVYYTPATPVRSMSFEGTSGGVSRDLSLLTNLSVDNMARYVADQEKTAETYKALFKGGAEGYEIETNALR